MKEYLTQNPFIAATFIVIVLLIAIFLFVKAMQNIGMEKIREYVYGLFIKAEHEFKHGENKEKFEYVILFAKGAIPAPFNLFITESLLREVVQLWFYLCKDLLDDGKMNGTVEEDE